MQLAMQLVNYSPRRTSVNPVLTRFRLQRAVLSAVNNNLWKQNETRLSGTSSSWNLM